MPAAAERRVRAGAGPGAPAAVLHRVPQRTDQDLLGRGKVSYHSIHRVVCKNCCSSKIIDFDSFYSCIEGDGVRALRCF